MARDRDKGSIDGPQMDQAKAAAQMGRRIQRSLMKTEMKAAMSRGKIQYPRTQRDWKKLL